MLQTAMAEETAAAGPVRFDLTSAPGVGVKTAGKLAEAGFGELQNLLSATPEQLEVVEGVGPKTARAILEWAADLAARKEEEEAPAVEAEVAVAAEEPVMPQPAAATMDDSDFMAALSRALKEAESEAEESEGTTASEPDAELGAEAEAQSEEEAEPTAESLAGQSSSQEDAESKES